MLKIGAKAQVVIAIIISHALFLGLATARTTGTSEEDTKPLKVPVPNDTNLLGLVYLGVVDGKSYFIEANLTLNWTEAKAYCDDANLELASIESKEQADFLNRTLRQYYRGMQLWTSLHESRLPSMMQWDGTNHTANPTFLTDWGWGVPAYQYCTYTYTTASYIGMYTYACQYSSRILCQSPSA